MANKTKPDNQKVKAIPATAKSSLIEKVVALSERRQWSISKTAGYLIERGLEAEQSQQMKAA